ncbi:hypothetical protein [Natronorubrum texcoconense]|uniref:Uncharacterized protein n=1 Tax=Natronorubrum texcoconense TaxID=1095776 RepID=A0A1G8Y4D7_9EURY|nr:hypothetical protein [Natronorubrum texcoconense]SDJ97656.1 hypothetical protein SAMN04515672_2019 [Natronorubrum texcoconense]
MAMDRIDGVAIVGFAAIIAASTALEGIVVAAALGGFALSLSSWRLYGGRPWEALAWLSWVGAAVVLVIVPGGGAFVVAFFGSLLLGVGLLLADRLDLLPSIWNETGVEGVEGQRDG